MRSVDTYVAGKFNLTGGLDCYPSRQWMSGPHLMKYITNY